MMLAYRSAYAKQFLRIFLAMKCAAAKIAKKLQTFEQKQRRMDIPQEMLTMFNDDTDLLKNSITGAESWVYSYDIETKAQSSHWKRPEEPKPKKARLVRSNGKVCFLRLQFCGASRIIATRSYAQ